MYFATRQGSPPSICKQKSLPARFIFNLATKSNKHKITRRRRKGTKLVGKSKSLIGITGRLDVSDRQNADWLREEK